MQLYESTKQIPDGHDIFIRIDTELIYSLIEGKWEITGRKKMARPVLSLVTREKLPLITSANVIYKQTRHWNDNPRPRCPYCTFEDTGNNVVTLSSGVKRGYGSHPRRFSLGRWCQYCGRTFPNGKVVYSY